MGNPEEIRYYIPVEGVKNKARSAYLTIDWFKKKFIPPLSEEYFEELPVLELAWSFIPMEGYIVNFDFKEMKYNFTGEVQKVILKKTDEQELLYVLLKKL